MRSAPRFGARHELYERNYAGNHRGCRIQAMWNARSNGALDRMIGLAGNCNADYDENGWTDSTWLNPDGAPRRATVAPRSPIRHERAAAAMTGPDLAAIIAGAARRAGSTHAIDGTHELDRSTPRRCDGRCFEAVGPDPVVTSTQAVFAKR